MELAETVAAAADGSYRTGGGRLFFEEALVKVVLIGVAGFFGAITRYGLEGIVSTRTRGAFPWATLIVNVTGCLVLGFVFALLTERYLGHPHLRTALTVGFLGAYTTFSTFAFETMRLGEDGATLLAVANIAANIGAGMVAVYAGTWAGRAM